MTTDTTTDTTLDNLRELRKDGDLADTFAEDVLATLTQPRGSKAIPPKHLYDARGSELFEQICRLDEYYVPRIEASIVAEARDEIAAALGSGAIVVEPGAGEGVKAIELLEAMDEPARFAPIEISEDALMAASRMIARRFPNVVVEPVCADFLGGFRHLAHLPEAGRIVFFPGSTIGNLEPELRTELLTTFADFAGPEGAALVGFDMVKDVDALRAAYDDAEGVSAAFALNLVDRINRELGTELDPEAFRYVAEWSADDARIEMAIEVVREQRTLLDGHEIVLEAGERIRTEHSQKFTPASIEDEASRAGLRVAERWTDERGWFSVCLLRPTD